MFRGQSVWECSTWLTENPNPPWICPIEWGLEDIDACSGPFRIVPACFDDQSEDGDWIVIAEHDTERPGPRHPNYYGDHTPLEVVLNPGFGLKYGIKAILVREYGTRPSEDEDRLIQEILDLVDCDTIWRELEKFDAEVTQEA